MVVAVFIAAGVVVGCGKFDGAVIWASLLGVVGIIGRVVLEGILDPVGILEGMFWKPWTDFAMSKYTIMSPAKIPSARM